MADKPIAATVRLSRPEPNAVDELLAMVGAEVETLRRWLELDPDTPHIRETGARLIDLGSRLVLLGGGS